MRIDDKKTYCIFYNNKVVYSNTLLVQLLKYNYWFISKS